jgi:hypothetical protein
VLDRLILGIAIGILFEASMNVIISLCFPVLCKLRGLVITLPRSVPNGLKYSRFQNNFEIEETRDPNHWNLKVFNEV